MPHDHVPVFQNSSRHFELPVSGFLVTHAVFAPGSTIASHVHERDVMAVMVAGSFDVRFDDRRLSCPAMSVHTEPAGERHCNVIGAGGAEVVVIQPDPLHSDTLRPFRAFLDSITQLEHGGIRLLARRLLQELTHPDACSMLAAESLILDMLVTLARTRPGAPFNGATAPAWLRHAREIVDGVDNRLVTVGEIAGVVGIHPATLARSFRAHYHLPIGAYARIVRLDAAARRLMASAAPSAQIAVEAGFTDQSHFTRRFKQRYGMTPEQYRRHKRPDRADG